MKASEFIKEKNRMCLESHGCDWDCPIANIANKTTYRYCDVFCTENPELAEGIVEQWSKNHKPLNNKAIRCPKCGGAAEGYVWESDQGLTISYKCSDCGYDTKEDPNRTKKFDILEKIKMVRNASCDAINRMGCSELWYQQYYAISQVFTDSELFMMPLDELENLIRLEDKLTEALY